MRLSGVTFSLVSALSLPWLLASAGAASVGLAACTLDKGTMSGPAPHPGGALDATIDETGGDAFARDGSKSDGPTGFDGPPPIEDTALEDFGSAHPPGEHVEALIGPAGGTLSGADGTPLVHVSLVVPPGALSTATLVVLDLDRAPPAPPALPTGVVMVTPYVRVGPETTSFAVPARLTLPYATTASTPSLVVLGRAGIAWSALLDPRGDVPTVTISAELQRASPAAAFLVTMTAAPKPSGFSPDHAPIGDVVFLEGTGFGLGPTWHPAGDGGPEFMSSVQVGSLTAKPLGWSDTVISLRVPGGSTGGTITVNGPAGSGSTTTSLVVP